MAPRKTNGGEKMTEEEMILLESSKHVSMATSALFYGNAFIVSVLPLCKQNIMIFSVFFILFSGLYWRIQMMDLLTYSIVFVVFTCVSTYLVAIGYKNLQHKLKYK